MREGSNSIEEGGMMDVDRVLGDGEGARLVVVGTPWKRVLRHVALVKVEEEEEEEEEAAALLEVDILIGDWMCRRGRRESSGVMGEVYMGGSFGRFFNCEVAKAAATE